MQNYLENETNCEHTFQKNGPYWHVCTTEDFPIIFESEEDFKAAMSIIALCVLMSPNIKVLAFVVMSNHLHFILCGEYSAIEDFFEKIRRCLLKRKKSLASRLIKWFPYIAKIETLENLRNAIAYVNRNGYVAYADYTPFSYPWGSCNLMGNPHVNEVHTTLGKEMPMRMKRILYYNRDIDKIMGAIQVDGYISPLSSCDIPLAESLFRNPRHYFLKLTKNLESMKEIAEFSGDRQIYTDEEMFSIAGYLSQSEFGCAVSLLPLEAKNKLINKLHFEYSACNKQIARVLRMDIGIINKMFPMSERK